jgi:hypothetical protein
MKHLITAAIAATFAIAIPSAFAAEQQAETKQQEPKPYPLKTCIVSGDKLGEMGKPVVFIHKGQEIRLCCKECRADFEKSPRKYLRKLPNTKRP